MTIGTNTGRVEPPAYPMSGDNSAQMDTSDAPALSRKKRGLADSGELWPQFSTIRISMMGMTKEQEKFTRDNINAWAPYVNLTFEFTDQYGADVRISANNQLFGGNTYHRTDALKIPLDKPTMEVGFLGGLNEFNAGTIMHEFGHVLGLSHEHHHPDNTLDLNMPKLQRDFWDTGRSDLARFLFPNAPRTAPSSAYDRNSIMHYEVPSQYLNSGQPVGKNNRLSGRDVWFAHSLYPRKKEASPPSGFRFHRFPVAYP